MKILDFIEKTKLADRSESEKAKLLCFFHYKETGESVFSMPLISNLFVQCGFNVPNSSRLKTNLTKGKEKAFVNSKGKTATIEFIPAIFQSTEKEYAVLWEDNITIDSDSELIDEQKFVGKRKYLDQLIYQINHSYANNCYDAAAVLMRRLFEVLLVLSYQNYGIDDQIKDSTGKGYIMLDGIVKNAKNNQILKISRIKSEFDTFRMVGNFSAHNITYTAGKKDIDDIKLNYRVMLEELYSKAGLTT
ncbi:MAG TPA: hypothetical protein H9851_05965 [Candidatus Borkfalkia faecavium]|uniref:DUF4145 domain-containing protein n=1 Tax=Candidatus Borkfalkia faecavium TaxID=2838508 RepID=A0A9D2AUK2_9FIRM|nr:hypothetical protein [Candidatus Borkfalkia faecavium]